MRAMKSLKLYKAIGLMSGTSMDGIDVAWIETDGLFHVRLLGGFSMTYTPDFYAEMKNIEREIKEAKHNEISVSEAIIQKIDNYHIQAILALCEKHTINPKEIDIIGYHGQTVCHRPEIGISIQLGNPEYLAKTLKMPVMGNVRQNDLKLGGQGAPVAPIYHQALVIRDNLAPAAVINCGGISNVTMVTGKENSELFGYDAGPGNGLLDRWVNLKTQGQESMDTDGRYALAGKVHDDLISDLYENSCIKNHENYYQKTPPKSLDIRDFHWTESFEKLSLEDGCATLAVFTAYCIVESLKFFQITLKNIILVGGGWHHPVILQTLKEKVSEYYKPINKSINIVRSDEIHWSSQYLEAELMAFLGVRRLKELPATFPMTTGVPYPVISGDIF